MKKFYGNRGRFAGLLIAVLFVVTVFSGALNPGAAPTGSPPVAERAAQTISNDVYVGTGYNMTSWSLSGGTQYMQGNLTVASGGVVTLTNEKMVFDQFASSNTLPGYESATIYHINVQDGGQLIMHNSTITTNLQLINDIPVLGMIVQDGGSLSMLEHSSLVFPGQFVVSGGSLTMENSSISGFSPSSFSSNYINSTVFPAGVFANPPVTSFFGASILMENSQISVFQNNTTGDYNASAIFTESYPFASDSGFKNTVQYTIEGVPTARNTAAPLADSTSGQTVASLDAFDASVYSIQAAQSMSVTDFSTQGVSEPIASATLNIAYRTQSAGATSLNWAYGNTSRPAGTVALPSTASYSNVSIALPTSMTVNDLSRMIAWVNATASTGVVSVNKLWIAFTFESNAYKNVTVGGSSSFTAIDSFIGANYSPSPEHHTSVVIADTAHAYFYNVHIDMSNNTSTMYSSALYGLSSSMVAKPLTFGPLNTGPGGNSLSLVDSNGAVSYAIPANAVFQTYGTNVTADSTLNTDVSSAVLSISSNSSTGATVLVGEIGQTGTINTGIHISNGIGGHYTVNLYSLGFKTLSSIGNLVIYIHNGATVTYLNNVNVQIQLLPQIDLYRFANVTIYSKQGLPVNGSSISMSYTGSTPDNTSAGSPAGYFVGPGNAYQTTPPAAVLSFMGKSAANYNVTSPLGQALIPLMTDVINAATFPDSAFVGNYTAGVHFNGTTYGNSLSFSPYPTVTASSQVLDDNITIGVDLPLPEIVVGQPYVAPSFIYVNQTGTLSFNVSDVGLTGVSSLPLNITDGANGNFVSAYAMNVSVGPQSTIHVSLAWLFNASGNNTISVFANQKRVIPESSYAGDSNSTVVYVHPNLPELVIPSSGITFNPSPAYSGKTVDITAAVQNFLGRAGAFNTTVAFYYGNPQVGGTLIGQSVMNISAGGSNTTTIAWTPNTIGQVPIYVYIDPLQLIQQYSTAGNLNSSVLIVQLSAGAQDLVVNDSNSNHSSPFMIPSNLNISSNVVVTQSGSLEIINGGLNFIESYGSEYSFLVNQSGELLIKNSVITSNQILNLYVYGNSRLVIENSVIGSNVNIILGGSSAAWVNLSTVSGNVSSAAFSKSIFNSFNTTYSEPLTVGYDEVASLYNISAPYVSQQSNAVVHIYRWLYITVFGPSGTTISDANVTLYTFSNLTQPNGSIYAKRPTNSTGVALFPALSDLLRSGNDIYTGNYVVNTSYNDAGTWYSTPVTVSLAHYTSPLIQVNSYATASLDIKLSDLVLTPTDIVFQSNPVVEASHVTVDVLVSNLGYGAVTSNFTVTFYFPGSNPVNVTTSLVGPLAINGTIPVSAVWSVPMSYGNMTVGAAVNLNRNVTEISYGNNFAQTVVDVYSLPDLSIAMMNATGSFQEFSNVTFNVQVDNSGQTGALNVPVVIMEGNSSQNLTKPVANGTIPSIGPGSIQLISIVWTVPQLPSGYNREQLFFGAVVNPNGTILESNYSQSAAAQAISINITRAQVNANVVLSSSSVKAGSYVSVTISVTLKSTGKPMPDYPLTVTLYDLRNVPQGSVYVQTTTGQNGVATARISIPQGESQGSYHFEVFNNGQFVSSSQSFNVVSSGISTGLPLTYWLLIIIVAIGAFVGFSVYLYRYGLARVVECGNCGAFIPETSRKCPYCSVEFEPGTAKCSNCSSWIPASSKECPICGVKFADEGESDQEDDATAQLRKQYVEYADKFKAQAKIDLGNKYSEKAFLTWWKKQSTYITFEDWLSKQQDVKKAKIITCPVCGEPNPQSAKECVKCGSQLSQGESGDKDQPPRPPAAPPPAPEGKPAPQEPRRIVVPRRIVRKVEEKPRQQESQPQADAAASQEEKGDDSASQ